MADCAIILYLEYLKGLIYHFKKLGQSDLDKKIDIKVVENVFKSSSNKLPGRFQLNLGLVLL